MKFIQDLLRFLDTPMTTPQPYGWFHLLFFVLSVVTAIVLCATHKKGDDARVCRAVFVTAIIVTLLEIYKQINFSFGYEDGLTFSYQWYAFPWQFCSSPMYIGLLAGIVRKGKIHKAACAYLGTYSMFAGICVMIYPTSVFIETIGINIQTMICHGSMITIGIYLLYSGYVRLEHKSILQALPVFLATFLIAMALNEIGHITGIAENNGFNMFYISPHCDPHLPLYSLVQEALPYPVSLLIYFTAFSLAAYLILLAAMGIQKLSGKMRNKALV